MSANPVPASLAKHGLMTIEDNLLPGQQVSFARMFCLIFRSELEARIFQKKKTCAANHGNSLPSPSE
ncbi:hypothetical protein [Nitrosovibrio sp. Nv6]|uniref:hypothetical protein n=1 Tax=Nitrosovibrio sp. Nv6 TaxID=1855340 RepID=UPI0008C82C76|nr:hypothetical protein [Nitrosovibrio sp. Nv6]SEO65017.1 hypothetical protein SAMN05216316_0710 [Nitrosovibrio sp. Nv6]